MADGHQQGDFGQSHTWPGGLFEHLDTFRQGHIVEEVPLFFASLSNNPLWSHPRRRMTTGEPEISGDEDGVLHHAMILTQSCDLMRSDNPWITVAPVYDAASRLNEGQIGNARAGKTGHLVHITAEWASHGFWVADLRLEMPLEKTLLIAKTPVEAFKDEDRYAVLAKRLGARRERPAVPDNCLEHVVKPLFDAVRRAEGGAEALNQGVREIRVQCNQPSVATVVTVFVVAERGEQPRADRWTALVGEIYDAAAQAGITIIGPEILTLDEMTASDYLTSAHAEDANSS